MLKISLRCSQACWSFQVYTARTDICLFVWFHLSVCFSLHWSSHFLPINVAFKYILSPTPWLSMPSLSCVLSYCVLGLMLTNSTPVLCVFMQKVRTYHQSKHILFTYLVRNVGEWHTAEVGGMKDGKHLGGDLVMFLSSPQEALFLQICPKLSVNKGKHCWSVEDWFF